MLLAEIREEVIRYALAKGIVTDENSLNYDALDSDILVARNKLGEGIIASRGKLSSQWLQTTLLEVDPDIQDSEDETIFHVPQAIMGIYTMLRGEKGDEAATIVKSVSEFYSGITKQIPAKFRGVVENGILRMNNPLCGNMKLSAAFVNPYEIPEWNVNYDNYPMQDGMVADLIILLTNNFYKYIINKPIDTKSDSAESTITPNQN
jgi:hypothetical protein